MHRRRRAPTSASPRTSPSRTRTGSPGGSAAGRRRRRPSAPKQQLERRAGKPQVQEKERGAVLSFFSSVRKELQKVQWPDRDTLVQASAVTILFVAVAAAYLGVLDAIFSRLVDLLIT